MLYDKKELRKKVSSLKEYIYIYIISRNCSPGARSTDTYNMFDISLLILERALKLFLRVAQETWDSQAMGISMNDTRLHSFKPFYTPK